VEKVCTNRGIEREGPLFVAACTTERQEMCNKRLENQQTQHIYRRKTPAAAALALLFWPE
jgi:hypothetical protein